MADKPSNTNKAVAKLAQQVGAKVTLKLQAQRNPAPGVWFGLGLMGIVGWSIVVPTLLGAALGVWLDRHYAATHSWTLALMAAGLVLGCFNAWIWVAKEDAAMHNERENHDDP